MLACARQARTRLAGEEQEGKDADPESTVRRRPHLFGLILTHKRGLLPSAALQAPGEVILRPFEAAGHAMESRERGKS